MLTIYGKRQSRAGRCLWALEELGLPYRQVALDLAKGETRSPEHLKRNPLGKVPVLADGDFLLTESVAINYYLAARQSTPLWPSDPHSVARIHQWSSWATTEVEFHFTVMVREMRRAAGGVPNKALMDECLAAIGMTFAPLEAWLSKGSLFVASNRFTIGDINAAFPIIGIAPRIDMTRFPAIAAWLERCVARPAWQRVQAIDEEALAPESKLAV
ncbi:glutathione S-transferase family protein [Massilia cavernae]|uniref:Glutathione S-transferase family protein n=1 Tax=Massilia cavernae TaxID=2320864 RepID=A0A418Y6C2_9BURK|nr:glutathione S-transferase family protein [Massilia cavernae]RJG23481.1 glutathione S-transferase family protein [Massilia cavernae]